jgi:hypothetical protein
LGLFGRKEGRFAVFVGDVDVGIVFLDQVAQDEAAAWTSE